MSSTIPPLSLANSGNFLDFIWCECLHNYLESLVLFPMQVHVQDHSLVNSTSSNRHIVFTFLAHLEEIEVFFRCKHFRIMCRFWRIFWFNFFQCCDKPLFLLSSLYSIFKKRRINLGLNIHKTTKACMNVRRKIFDHNLTLEKWAVSYNACRIQTAVNI